MRQKLLSKRALQKSYKPAKQCRGLTSKKPQKKKKINRHAFFQSTASTNISTKYKYLCWPPIFFIFCTFFMPFTAFIAQTGISLFSRLTAWSCNFHQQNPPTHQHKLLSCRCKLIKIVCNTIPPPRGHTLWWLH